MSAVWPPAWTIKATALKVGDRIVITRTPVGVGSSAMVEVTVKAVIGQAAQTVYATVEDVDGWSCVRSFDHRAELRCAPVTPRCCEVDDGVAGCGLDYDHIGNHDVAGAR